MNLTDHLEGYLKSAEIFVITVMATAEIAQSYFADLGIEVLGPDNVTLHFHMGGAGFSIFCNRTDEGDTRVLFYRDHSVRHGEGRWIINDVPDIAKFSPSLKAVLRKVKEFTWTS